jgi:uncharacterized protein YdiU (UPF0061 family)
MTNVVHDAFQLYVTFRLRLSHLIHFCMLARILNPSKLRIQQHHLIRMASSTSNGRAAGVSLKDLPKSSTFTSNLPADADFPTPQDSHKAPRGKLGPRQVRDAAFTYVRPEASEEPELLGVSARAMQDIGLKDGEEETEDFLAMASGNKITTWDEEKGEGVYPWAQCYGGWQFGSWAGQLGDGRAISLFESTNPATKTRYEIQLKGAGRTPYSRFADGRAVLRSSIREFVVSEYLNALGIPTTRALALTLTPQAQIFRERIEPGAIVTRFAQSWIRIGTFDLQRSRGNRKMIRQLATYVAEHVMPGWESLPARIAAEEIQKDNTEAVEPSRSVSKNELQGPEEINENRYARLYREIVRRNAKTVAAWQVYAFVNGVLNTDNTSIMGLSVDFGPFAFLDQFDPDYTPNHDDHLLRYSYKNQPTIIWWNLVRLGEDFGELLGAGDRVDEEEFKNKGPDEEFVPKLIKRAETIIERAGEEYQVVFMHEYQRLMTARLGLKTQKQSDPEKVIAELLDTMKSLELDFNQTFRKLSSISVKDIETKEQRQQLASIFFHPETMKSANVDEKTARYMMGEWLAIWRERIIEDWGIDGDEERQKAMKKVNPKFLPKAWVLDELITRVEKKKERQILKDVMKMTLSPFEEAWGTDKETEDRFCGDVPGFKRSMQLSCSS